MDVTELAKVVEQLTHQVEQLRVHLGLQPPKTIADGSTPPGKHEKLQLHEISDVIDRKASFTMNGPDIDITGQLQGEMVTDDDAVLLLAAVHQGQAGRNLKLQAATHLPYVLNTSDEKLAQFLSPLSSPERWMLLRALFEFDKTATEVADATGLKTGQMYHHLKELSNQRYVEQVGKKYALTRRGLTMFLLTAFLVGLLSEEQQDSGSKQVVADTSVDPLYQQACRIVAETREASASRLQRSLRIGYARVNRLLAMMESQGLIGPYIENVSREVRIRPEDLD